MAETIETFVDKLQADGVQAGQQAAEKIRAQADQQAQDIIRQAEAKAKEIIAQAEAETENLRTRVRTELELAARDTVLRLQETVTRALRVVLTDAVDEKLTDAEFLQGLLHEMVMQYVQADAGGARRITINLSDQMRRQLLDWAVGILRRDLKNVKTAVEIEGTLSEAGFEYTAAGGTVEVTVDSVTETLSELVAPMVREMIVQAMGDGRQSGGDS